jgi:hypothetical protein
MTTTVAASADEHIPLDNSSNNEISSQTPHDYAADPKSIRFAVGITALLSLITFNFSISFAFGHLWVIGVFLFPAGVVSACLIRKELKRVD